jgi:hypothetical protein
MFAAFLALAAALPACPPHPGEVLEMSGKVETGGLTGELTRRLEAGSGRSFEARDLGFITTRSGFDGKLAWSQDGSGGVHDLNSAFARRLAASMAWLDGRVGCGPSQRGGMTRLGVRTEGRRHFSAWRAAPPGGVPFELWYDARTGRLDRAFFQMAESRLIRHFADWRSVRGRLVPFLQRDEFPEDEDEVVRRIARASVRGSSTPADFGRPIAPADTTIIGGPFTSVPFDDDHRTRIYVPVMLNGKGPFTFELDNGGHNILTSETAAALGLARTGSFNSTGAGNAVSQAGIARVGRVQIGKAVITDEPFSVRDFSAASNDRSPKPPRAGILGLELFERFVVAIDPRSKTVILSSFDTLDRPAARPIPLVFTEDAPLIEGSFHGRRGDFMLDTGNAGPTIIEQYWAAPLGLTAELSKGVPRGSAKISRGSIGVGPFNLGQELVSYYGPAERGSEYTRAVAGVYGEPLLSRFKSTYDYSRGLVWLEPLPEVKPQPFDRSGLSLIKGERGVLKVASIAAGSSADKVGIAKDDLITAIRGVPSATLSRADAAAVLRGEPGTPIVLTGIFGGVGGARTIILRELVPR